MTGLAAPEAQLAGSAEGDDDLRRALVDFLALSALPDTWGSFDRAAIAQSTADALLTMLDIEGVHVHLPAGVDGAAVDIRAGNPPGSSWTLTPLERMAPIGLGGGFVAISTRAGRGLAGPVDRLLLNAAASQIAGTLDRRRAEMAERRLALLVERSTDFIGVADLEGRPHYLNAAARALVGLKRRHPLASLHMLDFIAPDERVRVATEALPAMSGRGHWVGESALCHFVTGEIIPVLLDCFQIDDPVTGRPANFAAVIRDLRPQKGVERSLRTMAAEAAAMARRRGHERDSVKARLDEVKLELFHAARLGMTGQMAAMLVHELGQPLTAGLLAADYARRLSLAETDGSAELRDAIEDYVLQTERAGTILGRWRQFVRPDAVPSRAAEDLRRLVEEAVSFSFVGPETVGVSLSCAFDPKARRVKVDRVQIQQVIANLVRNALDALHESATRNLQVSTKRRDGDRVEIQVADSGAGVAETMRDRLFQPFRSTKSAGMGLGLSVCRTIAEAHGGTIGYEPRAEGGSLFRVTLPAGDAAG